MARWLQLSAVLLLGGILLAFVLLRPNKGTEAQPDNAISYDPSSISTQGQSERLTSTGLASNDLKAILLAAHLGNEDSHADIAVLSDDGKTALVSSSIPGGSIYATIDLKSSTLTSYLPTNTLAYDADADTTLFFELHRVSMYRRGWTAIVEVPDTHVLTEETLDALPDQGTNPLFTYVPDGTLRIGVYYEDDVVPGGKSEPIRTIQTRLPTSQQGLRVSSDGGPEIGGDE